MPFADQAPLVAEARVNEEELLKAFSRMTDAVRVGIEAGTRRNRDMKAYRQAQQKFEEAADEFRKALDVNLSLMRRLAEANARLNLRLDWYEPDESSRPFLFSNLRKALAVLRAK